MTSLKSNDKIIKIIDKGWLIMALGRKEKDANKNSNQDFVSLIKDKMQIAYSTKGFNSLCRVYQIVQDSSVNAQIKSDIRAFFTKFVADEIVKEYDAKQYTSVIDKLLLIKELGINYLSKSNKQKIYSALKSHIDELEKEELNEKEEKQQKQKTSTESKVRRQNNKKTNSSTETKVEKEITKKEETKSEENKNTQQESNGGDSMSNNEKEDNKTVKPKRTTSAKKLVEKEKKKVLTAEEIETETRRLSKFGNFETIYKFLTENDNIPADNIEKLINTLCLRSDADGLYLAARDIKGASIARISKAMAKKKDIGLIYIFIREIDNAPVELLTNRLYELDKNVLNYLKENYAQNGKIDERVEKVLLDLEAKETTIEPNS